MTIRLVKLHVAVALCGVALYILGIGIGEWVGLLAPNSQRLGTETALGVSLLGFIAGGRLGWKTILEELAVKCD